MWKSYKNNNARQGNVSLFILFIESIDSIFRIYFVKTFMLKNPKLSMLLVEDDPYFSHEVGKELKNFGHFDVASFKEHAINLLTQNHYDLALIDLNLHEQDQASGLEVLKKAKKLGIYSIVLSNNENEEFTKEAYKLGCDHFLRKNNFKHSLTPYLNSYIRNQAQINWTEYFSKEFITTDQKLINGIKNLASIDLSESNIFISGETGVGKTHLAKLIHKLNYDNDAFVSFNCSQIPEALIESELFGYKKGAFSGADKDKPGLLELANHGTLFLDEIATMPLYTQQKLLKAIEEKEFFPLGAKKKVKVQFTLISATCENIQEKILTKQFRNDFYFRISGFEIFIPPLRKRLHDIEKQIIIFLSKTDRKFILEEEAFNILKNYSWPGNSRELKAFIYKLSLSKTGIISQNHPELAKIKNTSIPIQEDFLSKKQIDFIKTYGLKKCLLEVEKAALMNFEKKYDGKVTEIIENLKISNSSFYRIQKHI